MLWFFVEFINSLHSSLPNIFPEIKNIPKVHITLGPNNAIMQIASKAKPPETCKKFIEDNCKKYLNSLEKKTILKRLIQKVIQ